MVGGSRKSVARSPRHCGCGRPNPAIKRGALAWGMQFAAHGTSRLPPLLPCLSAATSSLFRGRKARRGGAHGVQLRGHGGGGGQVPRPPPQHHAHRRGHGVAQDDAEELVVRLLRPRTLPRPRRRAQVRLRAGHARRVIQVPPPPHQLPRPRPPGVPSLPGRRHHHLRRAAAGRAAVVLPHRRGAVTAPHLPQSRTAHPQQQRGERRREQGKLTFSLFIQGRELICSSFHLDAIGKQKKRTRFLSFFFFARLFVGVLESASNRLPSLHQKKSPCLY